jgi:hypothetical protein
VKVFHCDHCNQLLFFENVTCMRCGRALGYLPELADLVSLDRIDAGAGLWASPRAGRTLRLCQNYVAHDVCNVVLAEGDPNALCSSCRLTRTIPNLSRSGNQRLWYELEVAKRRLVYTLDQLGLPLKNRVEDPVHGVAFDFLEDPEPGTGAPPVLTGHAEGVITVNVAEADPAERVRRRVQLGEPYRTLLGHFRHEIGHYYWDELIRGSRRHEAFRALFGDERADYTAALQRHYQGEQAPAGWQERYVSAYATMHPWEDWAETWAHYLHMADTLETAAACGISLTPGRADEPTLKDVPDPTARAVPFERMLESWGAITYVLNNLNRGLGNGDAYPLSLSPGSSEKLRFVHETIAGGQSSESFGRASGETGPKH